MLNRYRIIVDDQYYCGEGEVVRNSYRFEPWSQNSFHTFSTPKTVLKFEVVSRNNFKVIEGYTNLLSEIKRILDFIKYEGLMVGNKIVIEAEPFVIPLELNINYYLDLEVENSKLRAEIESIRSAK